MLPSAARNMRALPWVAGDARLSASRFGFLFSCHYLLTPGPSKIQRIPAFCFKFRVSSFITRPYFNPIIDPMDERARPW
jgi:hypothetical protein